MKYDSILKQSEANKKGNKQFLQKLKKKPPKDLDAEAVELHEEVFEEIDCLECANCCKTTSPIFTDKDIVRIAKHFKVKPGEFIQQYLKLDEENDYVLTQAPCPFLGSDNYCGVYEARPNACREYPHTNRRKFHQITNLTYTNTLMCPAAAKVVEGLRKVYS